jgi:hypothetical protein
MLMKRDEFEDWYCAEIAQADRCHYCWITREELRDAGSDLCSWHIDRMDNDRPYERGNTALACGSCNSWKGDRRTYAETMKWAEPLRRLRGGRRPPALAS